MKWHGALKYMVFHCFLLWLVFLWKWSHDEPLVAGTERWPAQNQPIQPSMPLFPGYCRGGRKRCWTKPISIEAYMETFRKVARSLRQDETAFHDFDLDKLGTHSVKHYCSPREKERLQVASALKRWDTPTWDQFQLDMRSVPGYGSWNWSHLITDTLYRIVSIPILIDKRGAGTFEDRVGSRNLPVQGSS